MPQLIFYENTDLTNLYSIYSMNRRKAIISSLLFFILDVSASTQLEIDHLINYVDSTDCKYERNGKMHDGDQAVKHINKKYDYFMDEIKTAENFIKYSATKSELSGQYYKIHCPGEGTLRSQDWLLDKLQRYRAGGENG